MKMRLVATILCFAIFVNTNTLPINDDNERFFWIPDDQGNLYFVDTCWYEEEPSIKFQPEEDIKYFLYTRKNPTDHQEIRKGDVDSLQNSNFDSSKSVKFTIHGWIADYTSTSNTLPRDAFLDIDDVNMITVDWSAGAYSGYIKSARNAVKAGQSVGGFMKWINDTAGVPYHNMHVIGHSLGGQMTGIAARNAGGLVEYITALDPAYPLWGPTSERIRKTDAKYVEILHTNIEKLGMIDAVGHNDFYPNGGRVMPGCGINYQCSHSVAREYFAESIRTGGFTAIHCETLEEALSGVEYCTGTQTLNMGGSNIKPEHGIFALNTNQVPPYSQE